MGKTRVIYKLVVRLLARRTDCDGPRNLFITQGNSYAYTEY